MRRSHAINDCTGFEFLIKSSIRVMQKIDDEDNAAECNNTKKKKKSFGIDGCIIAIWNKYRSGGIDKLLKI